MKAQEESETQTSKTDSRTICCAAISPDSTTPSGNGVNVEATEARQSSCLKHVVEYQQGVWPVIEDESRDFRDSRTKGSCIDKNGQKCGTGPRKHG